MNETRCLEMEKKNVTTFRQADLTREKWDTLKPRSKKKQTTPHTKPQKKNLSQPWNHITLEQNIQYES